MFAAIEASAACFEAVEQLADARLPVGKAQHQHEIVPADMTEEISPRIQTVTQAFSQTQQQLVALCIAIKVDSAKYMNCCMGMPAGLSGYAKRIYKNDAVQVDSGEYMNCCVGMPADLSG